MHSRGPMLTFITEKTKFSLKTTQLLNSKTFNYLTLIDILLLKTHFEQSKNIKRGIQATIKQHINNILF